MKKYIALALSGTLLLSGCGAGNENTASGGLLGAQLGSIIGSAIGGINGGPRGSDIGTLVGMAGGAVVGAAVGSAADKANKQQYADYTSRRTSASQTRRQAERNATYSQPQGMESNGGYDTQDYGYNSQNNGYDSQDSGFDPSNSGDDIIDFDKTDATGYGSAAATTPQTGAASDCKPHSATLMMEEAGMPALEIRNVRYVGNGTTLCSGELARVTVEVYNNSTASLYNVCPAVVETTHNKHIAVSAPIIIEKIAPGKGIRYTAMVKADRKLKDGTAHFKVFASEKKGGTQSSVAEFDITTRR